MFLLNQIGLGNDEFKAAPKVAIAIVVPFASTLLPN